MKNSKNEKVQVQQESDELKQAREQLANRPPLPTGEEVRKWFEQDLKAAITCLHLVVESPKVMDDLCHSLYQEQVKNEQDIQRVLQERIQKLEDFNQND